MSLLCSSKGGAFLSEKHADIIGRSMNSSSNQVPSRNSVESKAAASFAGRKYCHKTSTLLELEGSRLTNLSLYSLQAPTKTYLVAKRGRMQIQALDAAMPFDYESIKRREIQEKNRLKIGIVGFGNFGQFLAKRFVEHNHEVLAWSRSDYHAAAKSIGVTFFNDADDFCEEHPEVVLLATSILSTDRVLRALPLQRLKRSTLFVDVLSVKAFPKNLLLQVLPPEFDILCTHPMFGPQSGAGTWSALPFVYDRVRVGAGRRRSDRCSRFLDVFAQEGCRMVEMSCEEHDRFAAGSQFLTHTVGRVLGQLELESTPINTKGYETLLNLVGNTSGDSFDLYYGLFMYNINATEELQKLEQAFDAVKKQLFDRLHNILRAQLFETAVGTASGDPLAALRVASSQGLLPSPVANAAVPGRDGGDSQSGAEARSSLQSTSDYTSDDSSEEENGSVDGRGDATGGQVDRLTSQPARRREFPLSPLGG
eukprot:jgi/Mesen1/6404/ME000329S05570